MLLGVGRVPSLGILDDFDERGEFLYMSNDFGVVSGAIAGVKGAGDTARLCSRVIATKSRGRRTSTEDGVGAMAAAALCSRRRRARSRETLDGRASRRRRRERRTERTIDAFDRYQSHT